MRLSTIMPGYLLGAKPLPDPMLNFTPGFILNYTHNEHELDPNLCVLSNIMISANRFVATEFTLSK